MQPVNKQHISPLCERNRSALVHSSEDAVREAKIKIAHLHVSAASALREEVNVVSPALYLPVLEPEDRKIRLLHNRREFEKTKKKKASFFPPFLRYMMLRSLPVST